MSSLATTVRAMELAGCTAKQIADVVVAHQEAEESRRSEKRAADAARQRKSRASRNVTVTPCDISGQSVTEAVAYTEDAPTYAEPEPNKTTYPTTSEANASSAEPQPAELPLTGELLPPSPSPKPSPPASTRGCRLPPGFPGESEREWTKQNLGFSDDDFDECAAEFRDYWSGVSGRHGVKCDWPATFRNGSRKFRPRRGSRQAYPTGNQRSDGSVLGAYQRAAARVRAQNDVSRQRPGVFDHRNGELEMRYGIPAE